MGLGEEDQSYSAIFIASYERYIPSIWFRIMFNLSPGWGSVRQVSLLSVDFFLYFFLPFSHCALEKKVATCSLHLRSQELWVEHLHQLFGILLNEKFLFCPIYLFTYMDFILFYFVVQTVALWPLKLFHFGPCVPLKYHTPHECGLFFL